MVGPHEVLGGLEGCSETNRSRGGEAKDARQVYPILARDEGEATRVGILRGGHEERNEAEGAAVAESVVVEMEARIRLELEEA